jgi:hypothetical protein
MKHMGFDKFKTQSNVKKDGYANVRLVGSQCKVSLVKISSETIKSKRNPAYQYLLP